MARRLTSRRWSIIIAAAVGLVVILSSVPYFYLRSVEENARVRIEIDLAWQFHDVQLVASDRVGEHSELCDPLADRALCSDGQGIHVARLGLAGKSAPVVLKAAFGIGNAELGDLVVSRVVCGVNKQSPIDLCTFLEVSAHSSRRKTCLAGAAPAEGDPACAVFWRGDETKGTGWAIEAATPGKTGYVGCAGGSGGGCRFVYGAAGGPTYDALYDEKNSEWVAWAPDEEPQVAVSAEGGKSGTTHVWFEIGADFPDTMRLGHLDGKTIRATLYFVFSSPGP
ncbi:MAG TPA: hypothetical protein VI893_04225 [Thermoplasmata archaeon]|nr:hypothetical protein [Thermoplasmata archaeon]